MATVTRSGDEFLVNTTVPNEQSFSAVTGLDNGRFVVTWQDLSQTAPDTSGYAVRAQIFNADGSKFGTEFVANTATTGFQLETQVTALANGFFVIIWTDFIPGPGDLSSSAVRGQIFDASGTKVGSDFVANTTTTGPQERALHRHSGRWSFHRFVVRSKRTERFFHQRRYQGTDFQCRRQQIGG